MMALIFVAGVVAGWMMTIVAVCTGLVVMYDRIEEADKDV